MSSIEDNVETVKKEMGPQVGLLWFGIMTTAYAVLKYAGSSGIEKTTDMIYFLMYCLMVIVGEYFINLSVTGSVCGDTQWGLAITVTIIPWLIIFGLMNIMLSIFPGWLTPFSNTIGYGITKLLGISDTVNAMLLPEDSEEKNAELAKALAHIYVDKSLLINEIPNNVEGYETFIKNMSPLMKTDERLDDETIENFKNILATGENNSKAYRNIADLWSYVRLKYIVSEYIWLMLTGALVSSVSYNYIIGAGCSLSATEMKHRYDKYIDEEIAEEKRNKEQKERMYTVTE